MIRTLLTALSILILTLLSAPAFAEVFTFACIEKSNATVRKDSASSNLCSEEPSHRCNQNPIIVKWEGVVVVIGKDRVWVGEKIVFDGITFYATDEDDKEYHKFAGIDLLRVFTHEWETSKLANILYLRMNSYSGKDTSGRVHYYECND